MDTVAHSGNGASKPSVAVTLPSQTTDLAALQARIAQLESENRALKTNGNVVAFTDKRWTSTDGVYHDELVGISIPGSNTFKISMKPAVWRKVIAFMATPEAESQLKTLEGIFASDAAERKAQGQAK